MDNNTTRTKLEIKAREWLSERGVTIEDIGDLVYYLQADYHDDLSMEDCQFNVEQVLGKREVQNAILTGIQLDRLAEENKLDEPLQRTSEVDESSYGIDRKSTRLNSSHVSIADA